MYRESDLVELKQQLTDEVKCEIDAFLNTKGGTIYIGVADDGTVMPFADEKSKDETDLKIGSWIREAFFPMPVDLIKHGFNEDGVLFIEIKEGKDKPYYLREKGPKPSGVYKRVGRSKRKATEEEILAMIMESKNYSYERDVSEEQELTFKYFFSVCEDNEIVHDKRHLKSLDLISKDDKYTNLALLMSDQSPIVVKFAKYDKNMNFLVKSEHKGSLLKVLNDVLEHADNYNETSAIIDGSSFKRIEKKAYPGAALREALLNAFAHADYFIRSNIKIEFFEDKVKITNPGGIYKATLEEIMDGIQTYRNPGLVRILSKLNYVENFGTGIPRILNAYAGQEKQPFFDPTENFFKLTLPNLIFNIDPLSDPIPDPILDPLTDFEIALMKTIKENPGLNAMQLLNKMLIIYPNATIDKVKNSLKRRLAKYCEFMGSRNGGGYHLRKKDEIDGTTRND